MMGVLRIVAVVLCLATFRGYAYVFSKFPKSVLLLKQTLQFEHRVEKAEKRSDHAEFLKDNIGLCDSDITMLRKKYPKMFSFDIDSNLAPTVDVFRSFGFGSKELKSILRISPQVFSLNSEWSIPEKLLEIQQTFAFSSEELIKIVTQYPLLLSFRKERHAELLAFFTETIGIPGGRDQLRTLTLRHRQLIGTSLTTLRSAWTELRDTLGFSQRATCRLITLHPSLLSRQMIDSIPQRLALFTEQLHLSPAPFSDMQAFLLKEPQLLTADVNTVLSPNFFLLRALLKWPEPELRSFLRANPSVLVLPPFRLKKKLFALLYLMTGDTSYIHQANTTVVSHTLPQQTGALSVDAKETEAESKGSEYTRRLKRLEQMLSVHEAPPRSTAQSLTLLFANDDDEGEIEFMEVIDDDNNNEENDKGHKRRTAKTLTRNDSGFFLKPSKKQLQVAETQHDTDNEEIEEAVVVADEELMSPQDKAAVQAMLQQYSSSSSSSLSSMTETQQDTVSPQNTDSEPEPPQDIFSQRKQKPIHNNHLAKEEAQEEQERLQLTTADAQYTPFFQSMIHCIHHQPGTTAGPLDSTTDNYVFTDEDVRKYDLLHDFLIDHATDLARHTADCWVKSDDTADTDDRDTRWHFLAGSTPLCATFQDTQHILKTAPQILLKRVSGHVTLLSSLAVSLGMTQRELSRVVRIMPRVLNLSVEGKVFSTLNNVAQMFLECPEWLRHTRSSSFDDDNVCQDTEDTAVSEDAGTTQKELQRQIAQYRTHPLRAALRDLLLRYPHLLLHSLNHVTDRLSVAQQLSLTVEQLPQMLRRSATQHAAFLAKIEKKKGEKSD